jgi:hypothetical protein
LEPRKGGLRGSLTIFIDWATEKTTSSQSICASY